MIHIVYISSYLGTLCKIVVRVIEYLGEARGTDAERIRIQTMAAEKLADSSRLGLPPGRQALTVPQNNHGRQYILDLYSTLLVDLFTVKFIRHLCCDLYRGSVTHDWCCTDSEITQAAIAKQSATSSLTSAF